MSDVVGVMCNAGQCANIDPVSALVIIALDSLITELQKKEPFGENNEIVKALRTAQNDLLNGVGPTNDIVKTLQNAWDDITKGMGPTNDIRKALEQIGFKF